MSAHIRELQHRICMSCSARASVEVFDTNNASQGVHCKWCAKARVRSLQANEVRKERDE